MTLATLTRAPLLAVSTVVTLLASPLAFAQDEQDSQRGSNADRGRNIVTVAFGAGMNTAQPGNEQNHHILPNVIRVRAGDVVNFVVSGLHVIRVSEHAGLLSPVVPVVPLQLLAYHAAVLRGTDVDKPRNLAKSVTVESVRPAHSRLFQTVSTPGSCP